MYYPFSICNYYIDIKKVFIKKELQEINAYNSSTNVKRHTWLDLKSVMSIFVCGRKLERLLTLHLPIIVLTTLRSCEKNP